MKTVTLNEYVINCIKEIIEKDDYKISYSQTQLIRLALSNLYPNDYVKGEQEFHKAREEQK